LLGSLKLDRSPCKPEGILAALLSIEFSDDGIYPASLVRDNAELVGHVVVLGWRSVWRNDGENIVRFIFI